MTTAAETKERLTQVIRVIKGLPKEAQWTTTWIGCAVGHSSRDPYFIVRGFHWSNFHQCPMYGKYTGVVAAMLYFGLSHDDFVGMFLRPPGVSRVGMVQAIRAHIQGLGR